MQSINELISLRDKTSLITGSASGIGKAMAERFAEVGSNLILVDIDRKRLIQVKEKLEPYNVTINTHICDLCSKDNIESLWTIIADEVPDILVNNAGIYPFKDFLEMDKDFYQKVMDINLNSMIWMSQNFIEKRGKKGGVIVNISSIEAVLPFKEDLVPYTISKAGVLALTRSLARDYGKKGFRVNALLPGGIITSGTVNVAKNILKLDFGLVKTGYDFITRISLNRMGKPDEVARMALVLASDLSSYVNGSMVPVDGGFLSS